METHFYVISCTSFSLLMVSSLRNFHRFCAQTGDFLSRTSKFVLFMSSLLIPLRSLVPLRNSRPWRELRLLLLDGTTIETPTSSAIFFVCSQLTRLLSYIFHLTMFFDVHCCIMITGFLELNGFLISA